MIFFGWGAQTKKRQLDQYHILLLTYKRFHIMWLFQIAWGVTYLMQTYTEQGWRSYRLNSDEVAQMQAEKLLPLNIWWHWGLLSIPLIIVVGLFANFIIGFLQG